MAGTAWLVSALGAVRTYGGNDGYEDDPETTYRWDSNVPNAAKPVKGDFIVVRSKYKSIGASVIDSIRTSRGSKTLRSCPFCDVSDINERKTRLPKYRCAKCKKEFDDPNSRVVEVTQYVARYEAAWFGLEGIFKSRELLEMCEQPKAQFSIREIDWRQFASAVALKTGKRLIESIERRHEAIEGGHFTRTTRVRKGQAAFRQSLIDKYGAACAFTGPAPVEALDAAHLYSFAKDSIHHEHGGLLLRKDLHRLFDVGLLAVDPVTRRISATSLEQYPGYARLDSSVLYADLHPAQMKWIQDHWNEHRPDNSAR